MIEKCAEFRRFVNKQPSFTEGQYCGAQGVGYDTGCGGFSDFCKFPEKFISQRGIPNAEVTFREDKK